MGLFVVVADDVGVVVGFLEDGDFALGEGYEVLEEAFDGYCAALEGAFEDYCSVGAESWVVNYDVSSMENNDNSKIRENSPRTVSETTREGSTGTEFVGGGTTILEGEAT